MIEQKCAGIITFIEKDYQILYLVLHYLSGHWDFPKGKIEPEETLIQAAHRELYEETGLRATLIDGFQRSLEYVFKERGQLISKTVTYFLGKTEQETVVLSREHTGYLWLPYTEAYQRLTYRNAQLMLESAHTFLSNKIKMKGE